VLPAPPAPPPPGSVRPEPTQSGYPPAPPGYTPVQAGYPQAHPWNPSAREPRALVAEELRISRPARLAIAFPALTTLVDLIGWVSDPSQWRHFGHQFHLALEASQNNQTSTLPAVPNSLGGLSTVVVLFALAAIVVECIWQFRAASAARAMRYPAARSPGWGVAFWFIPIVNLWMPYQAIRDCLAPGDPNRAVVLRYWLLFLGMGVGAALAIIGLMTSTPIGVVFAVLSGCCALGVLATAPTVVSAIATAHHAAVNP
jgi:hypothetical protein